MTIKLLSICVIAILCTSVISVKLPSVHGRNKITELIERDVMRVLN